MTSQKEDLAREAMLMTRLNQYPHQHLLPLLAIEYDASSRVSMVVPIAKFGSMLDLVDHLDFDGLSISLGDIGLTLYQISTALLHLDSIEICHGDVTARNVLVFKYEPGRPEKMVVKLGDYGEANRGRESPSCIVQLACELQELVPR